MAIPADATAKRLAAVARKSVRRCMVSSDESQTSTTSVFSSTATDLAEQRFDMDPVKAGW
jgi:hypothetical protein